MKNLNPEWLAVLLVGALTPNASACQDELRRLAPQMEDGASRLYESIGYNCLWTRAGVATPQARAVGRELEAAADKGLEARDYAVPASTSSKALRTEWDLAFTQAVLRFVSDLCAGRVNRGTSIGADRCDVAAQVRKLAADPSALQMVEPQHDEYRRTLQALHTYLQLAQQQDQAAELPEAPEGAAIKPGDAYAGVAALAARLTRLGDLPTGPAAGFEAGVYDGALVDAVKRFQARHGLEADGVIGRRTVRELNVPVASRVRQLQLALERWRSTPPRTGGRSLEVNIPEFRLRAFEEDGATGLEMRVVVGVAARHQTPVFSASMNSVSFRPYWNVPWSIQRKELMPEIEKNFDYLAQHNLEVVTADGALIVTSVESDPIDVLAGLRTGKLRLRQTPGPHNALGLVAFILPNEHAVYLHDSPQRHLYSRPRRDFSHGCVRLENPGALAGWVLKDDPQWPGERIDEVMNGADSIQTALRRAIPVAIVYRTVMVPAGGAPPHFLADVYGLDAVLERQLMEPRFVSLETQVQSRASQ